MFHDIFFGDATVTDMAFRTARFKQFTGNLQKCLEDLAKGRLAKAGLAKGGGGNGIDVFFSPQDSDSYRGSMLGFMLSGVYAGIIGRFFWVLKFEWCNGVVKDGSLWSL